MKSYLTQNVNIILGTALLASVALAASLLIVDISANAEEEFLYLTIEHRLYKESASAGLTDEGL